MSEVKFTTHHIQEQVLLAPFTTMKVGGPARWFFEAQSTDEIIAGVQEAVKKNISYIVIGRGANILISDKGFNGLVILARNKEYSFDGEILKADAGVDLAALIMQSAKRGLSGLEFAAGIPSSLGGAVRGNAGSMGSEMKNIITEVEILYKDGKYQKLSNDECKFVYRGSRIKEEKDIVLSATLKLTKSTPEAVQKIVKDNLKKKQLSQDLKHPSSGCIFKNPEGMSAGKLIEDTGLKGFTVGGAKVSEVHANFIINTGQAKAEDIVILMSLIKQKVRIKQHVQLMEEIQYVGF